MSSPWIFARSSMTTVATVCCRVASERLFCTFLVSNAQVPVLASTQSSFNDFASLMPKSSTGMPRCTRNTSNWLKLIDSSNLGLETFTELEVPISVGGLGGGWDNLKHGKKDRHDNRRASAGLDARLALRALRLVSGIGR